MYLMQFNLSSMTRFYCTEVEKKTPKTNGLTDHWTRNKGLALWEDG